MVLTLEGVVPATALGVPGMGCLCPELATRLGIGVPMVGVGLGVLARSVPATGGFCPKVATAPGALVLMPEDEMVLATAPGVLARGVPGVGSLCPEVATTLGALVLTPKLCPVLGGMALMPADGVTVVTVLGVLARSVPGVGGL